MKILNLYSGIGGNRQLWPEECQVTAVENNNEIAKIYQDFFPKDRVIVADAHKYLLEHFEEFDFIWSSRPCQSHSKARFWSSKGKMYLPIYPDMKLYQEIIFLNHYFNGKWVVENVIPYYKPLREPQIIGRHCFWANFSIEEFKTLSFNKDSINKMQDSYGIDISKYKLNIRKDKVLRNCVKPELGLHVFNCAFKEVQQTITKEFV